MTRFSFFLKLLSLLKMSHFGAKLPKTIFQMLNIAGINTPQKVVLKSDAELLRLGNLTSDDITNLKEVASKIIFQEGFTNAYNFGKEQASLGKLSTGCDVLDVYLRGGLRPRTVIEIYGESGCGKTQIALQVAANCWKNGAVYICTEDVFPSKRLQQIFKSIAPKQKNKVQDLSKYGEKIFVIQVTELDDLKQCLNVKLPHLLSAVKTISLVVLDSVAAPFRGEFQNDMKGRAQHLKEIGLTLFRLAKKHNLVALCINQVSANMNSGCDVLPCLGMTWSNMLTTRIKLSKTEKYCHVGDVLSKTKIHTKDEEVESCSNRIGSGSSMAQSNMLQIRQFSISTSPELPSDISAEYVITANGVVGLNVS